MSEGRRQLPRRHRGGLAVALVVATALAPSGCKRSDAPAASFEPEYVRKVDAVAPGAAGPRPSVRISLDRTSVTVADRLTLELVADVPARWTVHWPEVGDSLGDFAVSSNSGSPPAAEADRVVAVRRYSLDPFLPGRHIVPGLEFRFDPPAGGAASRVVVSTRAIDVDVFPVVDEKAASADIGPIRGVVALGVGPSRTPWIVTAAFTLTAALAGAVTMTLRRRRPTPEPPTPFQTAQSDLRSLETHPLDSPEDIDAFFVRLTSALREYAAARFGLPPTDRTTEQLLADLHGRDTDVRARLSDLLTRIDQLKFAGLGAGASVQQARSDLAAAWAFVTRYGEAPAPGGPA